MLRNHPKHLVGQVSGRSREYYWQMLDRQIRVQPPSLPRYRVTAPFKLLRMVQNDSE